MNNSTTHNNNITTVKIASWNLKSFKNNCSFIINKLFDCDIVLLQETWLHQFEENLVHTLHPDFLGVSISSIPPGT